MTMTRSTGRVAQGGSTAVEFALVAMVLITLILGIIQFAIVMFTFNSAAQATRSGARVAVVNVRYANTIVSEMKNYLRDLSGENVVICYPQNVDPPGEYVVVRLAADDNERPDSDCNTGAINTKKYKVAPWFFWPVEQITVPSFTTLLPRESLGTN